MNKQKELLQLLCDCVVEMEDEKVVEAAEEYIRCGYPPMEGILKGLVNGMKKAADLYEEDIYFIPELLLCSDAMYNGLNILRPHLEKTDAGQKIKVVIGVVEGDTHDIGKNLVKIMLETAGYEIIDLGRDVPAAEFIASVQTTGARVLALSTLMSTSTNNMKKVIELLQEAGLRNQVKVIIGGGPISAAFAKKIGADGYSENAVEAVKLVDQLLDA